MSVANKWETRPLGKFVEFRNGVNYNKNSFGEGMKVVGVKDFQDYIKPKYSELSQINPDGIVTEKNILHHGDIVFVRSNGNRDLIGRSLFIDNPTEPITHSAFTIRLRFTANDIDPRFYAYFLRSPLIRKSMTAFGGGTNISNLNQDILSQLEVPFPPQHVQKRIAEILSAYDNLIENNQRRIDILEEIIRLLYREWFVYFRYPGHKSVPLVDSPLGSIPKGWEVKSVGELLQRLPTGNKYTQENTDQEGAVPVIDQSEKEILGFHNNEADHKASMQHPIIIFGDHTCKMKIMIKPFSVGPNTIAFTGVNLPESFLYFLIRSLIQTQEYKRHWNELIGKKVVVSKMELSKKFSDFVAPLLEQATIFQYQVSNLSKTRDLLLPRLLSGQIPLDKKVPVA